MKRNLLFPLLPAALFGMGVVSSITAADYQATVLQDQPVGYWRLGETAGPTIANLGSLGAAGNGVASDEVFFGQPGLPQSGADTAVGFDGIASKIEVSYSPELNPETFTFEVWANSNPDTSGHRSPMASRDDTPPGNTSGVIFYADPSDSWQFWNGRGSQTWHILGDTPVAPGEWAHLVGTYDGTNKAFYVNGVLVGAARTTFQPNRAQVFRIGASANENPVGQFFFNGNIDEPAVYKGVLSEDRILAHYKAGSGTDPMLVPPAIVGEPQALEVFNGDSPTLFVLATGSLPLSYQWRFNGADISGATGSSLILTNVQSAAAGAYSVLVKNAGGEIASADATLTVTDIATPVITQQPTSRTVLPGASTDFTVQASGSTRFSYQWQFNGVNIPGATNSTLTVSNVQTANLGAYKVIVSNQAGSTTSDEATLKFAAPVTKSYFETVTADGPVSYWRLDETSGEVADDAIGQNDGLYLNGVTLGLPGALLDKDGAAVLTNTAVGFQSSAQQKVDVAFTPDLNPDVFTAEVWAQVTGTAGAYRSPLTSRGDAPTRGYIFYAEPGNTWQFWTGGGDAGWNSLTGPAVLTNTWTYLAGTFDGTTKRFYVNGVEVASSTPAFSPNTENPLRIGAGKSETEGDYFFEGNVDEVAIYNKVLTPEQIMNHFAAGRPAGSTTQPFISVQRSGTSVVITWNSGQLQEAGNVNGPWQDVLSAASPWNVTPSGDRKFYRVK